MEDDHPNDEPDEFEDFVDALLKVDPRGLSGKHHAEHPAYNSMTDDAANREATRLNEVLAQTRGLTLPEVTAWWNEPNPELGGFTPVYLWNGGHYSPVRRLIESMPS